MRDHLGLARLISVAVLAGASGCPHVPVPKERSAPAEAPAPTITAGDASGGRVGLATAPNFWKYETTSSYAAPTWPVVWEGGSEEFLGGPAFFLESVVVSAGGASRVHERRYFRSVPAGIYQVGTRSDVETAGARTVEDTALAPSLVELPRPLQLGASWAVTGRATIATTSTAGVHPRKTSSRSSAAIVGSSAVTGREQVIVPAGTFDCLVVQSRTATRTSTDDGALAGNVATTTTVTTSWYAPAIGLVKSVSTEDVELEVKGTKGVVGTRHRSTSTMLRSYHLTGASFEMAAVGLAGSAPDAAF